MAGFLRRIWGGAHVATERTRTWWVDLLLLAAIIGFLFAVIGNVERARHIHTYKVDIHLSPAYLPLYTFYSLCRGLFAYAISLAFTLVYGYWAAKDHRAERVLIPLLDILQSIPVLSFLPIFLFSLVAIFPHSSIGVELASVLSIFTGQAWNMTFSLYRSLRTVPAEQQEAATIFRFSRWQRITQVELPFATMGLVWNSMMSMAGGWFFLSLSESFLDFQLPGLGSYVQVALDQHYYWGYVFAVVAMVTMIVLLDQLLWRPLVAWAQKFRVEEGGQADVPTSWFLDVLRRSRLLKALGRGLRRLFPERGPRATLAPTPVAAAVAEAPPPRAHPLRVALGYLPVALLLAGLIWCCYELFVLIRQVSFHDATRIVEGTGVTLVRVILSVVVGTLWAVPAGLAIGLSPRLSRIMQPIIQIAASFPAPMLFPLVILGMERIGITLGFSSIVLMLLGTQWYILFNVITGAMGIPADLREAARTYNVRGFQLFRQLYFPAVFPYLVTGWVTASGGAWNASIVAEYYQIEGTTHQTFGLGQLISQASDHRLWPLLAASVLAMAIVVVGINRLLWHRLYRVAETTYSLNK